MRQGYLSYVSAVLTFFASLPGHAEIQPVGRFSDGLLTHWEEKSFQGHTRYSLVKDSERDATVLQAHSQAGASGLVHKQNIELTKTPYLNWSWKITNTLEGNDEQTKPGDDYPARIYIVVSGGLAFWKTRALNYVWSSHQGIGQHWPNAYTGNAHMVSIQSGAQLAGQWRHEKRNVREDLQTYFGDNIQEIHAVAIMTDTDNTGADITAYYGDIYFSSE
jgi:hypothetical protein